MLLEPLFMLKLKHGQNRPRDLEVAIEVKLPLLDAPSKIKDREVALSSSIRRVVERLGN